MSQTLRLKAEPCELDAVEADLGIVYMFKGDAAPTGPIGKALATRIAEVARQDRPTALFDVEDLRYRAGPAQLSLL